MAARRATPDATTDGTTERITVSLIPKASAELFALQESTKMSRTDIVNRAISLYAFISKQLDSGNELAVHNPKSETTQIVHVV